MTERDTQTHPPGLLTDDEAESLTDPDIGSEELAELRARIRTRLSETLLDLRILYPTLPAEDIDTVFSPTDAGEQSAVRAATQDGLALLILGMLHGDDMIEMRLRDALVNAGVSYDEDIDATIELRRGPLPTLEQFAAQVDEGGLTEQAISLFEYFLGQSHADIDTLDAIASDLQMEITNEEKDEMRTALAPFERQPQSVITGVSITDGSIQDDVELDS